MITHACSIAIRYDPSGAVEHSCYDSHNHTKTDPFVMVSGLVAVIQTISYNVTGLGLLMLLGFVKAVRLYNRDRYMPNFSLNRCAVCTADRKRK